MTIDQHETDDALLLQQVLDVIVKVVALEVATAENRLRVELHKSQADENKFVRDELIALREDLCRILRDGSEPGDIAMRLSDKYRRNSAEESKTS